MKTRDISLIVSIITISFVYGFDVGLLKYGSPKYSLWQSRISKSITTLYSTPKVDPNVELFSHIKFSILGGGAFSLAMARVLSYKNISCNLLVRSESVAQYINENHYHPKYLTDSLLPSQLRATSDPAIALNGTNYIIHAVPMQQSREFLGSIKHLILPKVPILSVTKGVELGTFSLMNDIFNETIGSNNPTAFLSGPSFAKEIMDGEATAVVIASEYDSLAKELAEILSSVEFRCHTSRDVTGIELGGAIKNVIALAAGMCEGLDLGTVISISSTSDFSNFILVRFLHFRVSSNQK